MKRLATVAALLIACTNAQADLIAEHRQHLSIHDAIFLQLSDETRDCHENARYARVMAAESGSHPILYAEGCWSLTHTGGVWFDGFAFDGSPLRLEYRTKHFYTTPSFKGWKAYFWGPHYAGDD